MSWFYLLGGLVGGGGLGYLTGWTRGYARGSERRPSPPIARALDYRPQPPDPGEHGSHHHICKPGCEFYGNQW